MNEHSSYQEPSSKRHRRPSVLVMSVVGGIVGIGVLLVILAQSIEITIETTGDDRPSSSSGIAPSDSPTDTPTSDIPDPISPEDLENGLELPEPAPAALPSATTPAASPNRPDVPIPALQGSLRVSNQTIHPIRVALLPQQRSQPQDIAQDTDGEGAIAASSLYQEPVHWDFVPGEGAARGLTLGLPDADLVVQPGDVMTAFAQDGSQIYWGPYVVGETDLPRWNAETEEWVLVLRVNENPVNDNLE